MDRYIGKICPYCKTAIRAEDDIIICSHCEMPHHKDCWIENQGCTTFGCSGTIQAPSAAPAAPFAPIFPAQTAADNAYQSANQAPAQVQYPAAPVQPQYPAAPVQPQYPTAPVQPGNPSPANPSASPYGAPNQISQNTRYCTKCGARNTFGNLFCVKCGNRL